MPQINIVFVRCTKTHFLHIPKLIEQLKQRDPSNANLVFIGDQFTEEAGALAIELAKHGATHLILYNSGNACWAFGGEGTYGSTVREMFVTAKPNNNSIFIITSTGDRPFTREEYFQSKGLADSYNMVIDNVHIMPEPGRGLFPDKNTLPKNYMAVIDARSLNYVCTDTGKQLCISFLECLTPFLLNWKTDNEFITSKLNSIHRTLANQSLHPFIRLMFVKKEAKDIINLYKNNQPWYKPIKRDPLYEVADELTGMLMQIPALEDARKNEEENTNDKELQFKSQLETHLAQLRSLVNKYHVKQKITQSSESIDDDNATQVTTKMRVPTQTPTAQPQTNKGSSSYLNSLHKLINDKNSNVSTTESPAATHTTNNTATESATLTSHSNVAISPDEEADNQTVIEVTPERCAYN